MFAQPSPLFGGYVASENGNFQPSPASQKCGFLQPLPAGGKFFGWTGTAGVFVTEGFLGGMDEAARDGLQSCQGTLFFCNRIIVQLYHPTDLPSCRRYVSPRLGFHSPSAEHRRKLKCHAGKFPFSLEGWVSLRDDWIGVPSGRVST